MAPIARSTLLARALRARAGTVRQSFTRLPRRSYASGHGPVKPTLQSEMPWIASSLAVTVGGVYLLWPEPPAHGHGHDDHAEHKEEKEEKEEKDEKDEKEDSGNEEPKQDESEDNAKDESKDDAKDEGKDEPKEEDTKSEDQESKDDADKKDESEDSDEDKSEKKPKKAGTKEDPDVNEDRDDNNREVKYKDAKGGVKKRLESTNAIAQGGKSAGVHSGQGEHVYNTDTKHSTDQKNNPSQSKKGEGDAETAKLKTTVDPKRKQV